MSGQQKQENGMNWSPTTTVSGWNDAESVIAQFDQSGRWDKLTDEYYRAHSDDEFVMQNYWSDAVVVNVPLDVVH